MSIKILGYRQGKGSGNVGRENSAGLMRQVSNTQTREGPNPNDIPSVSPHPLEPQTAEYSPSISQVEADKNPINSASPKPTDNPNHFHLQSREPDKLVSTSSSPSLLARLAHSTSPPNEGQLIICKFMPK